jgi:ubiquinone/menaquinone biosynthesis C-methylase UbiE
MLRFPTIVDGVCAFAVSALLAGAVAFGQAPGSPRAAKTASKRSQLPAPYPYIAADILEYCRPRKGIWVDLGSGSGGVGFALAAADSSTAAESTIVLVDPDAGALAEGVRKAQSEGLGHRVVAVVGKAERMPFPDGSVDLVVSRGSIFFWDDPAKGVAEVYRVLRPGGEAIIGGGRGKHYPEWARREFARRRHGHMDPNSEATKRFRRLRSPETFRQWAEQAGVPGFKVIGQGGLSPDDPRAGKGIWLRFGKPGSE